jgi:hypothetical protein
MLRRFGGTGGTKEAQARAGQEAIVDKEALAKALVLEFCQRPRQWVTFVSPGVKSYTPKRSRSAIEFLTSFGPNTWTGPFDDGSKLWFVYTVPVPHHVLAGGDTLIPARIRWHVVAEVTVGYCALHWNGFTRRKSDEDDNAPAMFDYWHYVPDVLERLFKFLGAPQSPLPSLNTVVLTKVFDLFVDDPDYKWTHLKIRAEKEGIALNASSGKVREIDVTGLDLLTRQLAKGVLRPMPIV